jgi:hypothetical protein
LASKSLIKNVNEFDQNLCDFLNFIWNETVGSIDEIFDFKDQNKDKSSKYSEITIEQVRKSYEMI